MCQKCLKVVTQALQETVKEQYLAHSLALAVVLKENQLDPAIIIKILINGTREEQVRKNAALIALSKIAEVFQIELHGRLQPDEVRSLKQFVLDNDWNKNFTSEIETVMKVMKFNLHQPQLQSARIFDRYTHQSNIVAVTYDQQSCTLFSGGYDNKIVYWDCAGEIEQKKLQIDLLDQEIVSLDWCDRNQLLLGCTRCGSDNLSPVLFGYGLVGNQKFFQQSSAEALYVCKSMPGTDRCLTSETVTTGGQKRYIVKVYNVELLGCAQNLQNLPPENIIAGHGKRVSDVQSAEDMNPDIILTTSFDRRAKLWDLRKPSSPVLNLGCYTPNYARCPPSNERAHNNFVHSGDLAIYKNTVLTGGQDFVLKNWDIRNTLFPLIQYNLDDSAVIKVRLNKLGGIVRYGCMCAASTMSNLFTVNLQSDVQEGLYSQVCQQACTATRDFVWVKKEREQYMYASQNEGVIAKYSVCGQY